MSATAIQTSPAQLSVIGRYTVAEEARVLVGRRIEGKVFVYDYPRDGQGRRYFVESGFASKAELAVLLADYRREAKRLGTCPMSHDAIERAFQLAAPAGAPHDRTLGRAGAGAPAPASGGSKDKGALP